MGEVEGQRELDSRTTGPGLMQSGMEKFVPSCGSEGARGLHFRSSAFTLTIKYADLCSKRDAISIQKWVASGERM